MHYEDRHLDFVLKHYSPGKFDTQKAIGRFETAHPGQRRRQFKRLSFIPAAASVAVAALLAVGVFLFMQNSGVTELVAGTELLSCTLPDGTQVTLAPGAELSYKDKDFMRKSRSVRMEGKVFFEVQPDESRPFEVRTDGGFVRVLGTEFQVDGTAVGRTSGTCVAVYVRSGRVLFAKSEHKEGLVLTEGMSAVLEKGRTVPELEEESDVNAIAWQRGTFIFNDCPLKQVLDELGAYYGHSFVATDLDKRLSGEFSTEDPDLIIELIESALDVTIVRK